MRLRARAWLVAVAALGCGEITCSSHEIVHEENGRRVQIAAEQRAGVGIGLAGAPHAFAIAYPQWEDGGIRIMMTVDDRPPVLIGHESDGDLEAIAGAIEVAVSDDGLHVASRHRDRWQVFHLLPKGTPFDAPGPATDGDAIDFAAYGTPEEIAIATLADESQEHGARFELLLRALHDQDPSPALDRALLHGWPGGRHQSLVMSRLAHQDVSEEFRNAVFERVQEVIAEREAATDDSGGALQEETAMFEALVLLGPERVAWLDERMVARWEALSGAMPSRLYVYFSARRDQRRPFTGAEPMSEPLRVRAAAAARRWLEAHHVTDERFRAIEQGEQIAWAIAVEYVAHEGTDADERWLHDVLLASWPVAGPVTQVHDSVVHVAVGRRLGEPTDDWKRAALRAAEREIASDHLHDATELLVALDAPEASIDRAFDALLARGGFEEARVMGNYADRSSERWRRATIARARSLEPPERSATRAEGTRDAALRELGFNLARGLGDCEAMNALALRNVQREQIPASCARPSAPSPATPAPPAGQ